MKRDAVDDWAVHPRIRGERFVKCHTIGTGDGSSPHTRGTRERQQWRQIPGTVHPRIRGERRHEA